MSEHEGITGELRGAMSRYSTFDGNSGVSMEEERFDSLCDAIDSVHRNLERENKELRRELDRVTGEMEEHHAWAPESHYVMLPKDSAGEPIHIGDVMDGYGKTIEVVELRYGRSGWVLISRDGNGYADTFAFTHHHAPTVEDVLRKFAYGLGVPVADSYVAAAAAKLQLRGDAE